MLQLLTKPVVWAIGGGAAAYFLYKKSQDQGERLKVTKLELIEQQRTIDRLRAEVGRERNMRQELIRELGRQS
jgi:hypothetical protein